MIQKMKTKPFYNLLEAILTRPHMFGIEGVDDLGNFIQGYQVATLTHGIKDKDFDDFGGFTEFVAKKFEITSTHNWANIISFYSSDRRHSLEVFQSELERFKERIK